KVDIKTYIIVAVIKIVLVVFILLTGVAYTTLLERKLVARIQNRWGPTRVGPFGLLQPLADGIKFILKEDMVPDSVHKVLYIMAPMLALAMSLISIAVYGVALAGWSSNSKYSLLGSLRASAQMISYELALGLSLVGVLLLS